MNLPQYILPSGVRLRLPSRFSNLKLIGQGAYGSVVAATDNKNKRKVAIKKIQIVNDPSWLNRILREIIILRAFKHENIVRLFEILPLSHPTNYNEIYLVTDLMETDLETIIQSDQVISEDHIQYFMYQILCGVKYIHSASVIHRDLKPGNILINSDCDIKICDFGLAVNERHNMTQYVVTRWYRAPELIMKCREYSKAIDMWSLGCIMAELYLRVPLFQGKDPFQMWKKFIQVLGKPRPNDFKDKIPRDLAELTRKFNPKKTDLSKLIPNASNKALDLIKRLLVFNPKKRLTVTQALSHPYFKELHSIDDELVCSFKLNFDYEYKFQSLKQIKQEIFKQCLTFNPAFMKKIRNPMIKNKKSQQQQQVQQVQQPQQMMQNNTQQQQQQQQQNIRPYNDTSGTTSGGGNGRGNYVTRGGGNSGGKGDNKMIDEGEEGIMDDKMDDSDDFFPNGFKSSK